MKKDILIPNVSGVKIAAAHEYNKVFKSYDWNVYFINEKEVALETVLIVSKGFDQKQKTSTLRKKIDFLPANSYAKVELIQPDLFELENQFQVTFFEGNQLFDKTFTFPRNSINESVLRMIPALQKRGVLAK